MEQETRESVVIAAELEFVWASFASKIPLLALFWYSISNTDFGSQTFDVEAGVILGCSLLIALVGVIYFGWFRGRCTRQGIAPRKPPATIADLEMYHGISAVVITGIATAMLIYIGQKNVTDDPNRSGTVVNTFSVWSRLPDGKFVLNQKKEVIGGSGSNRPGIQLAALPPAFALISAMQHLVSWIIFKFHPNPEMLLFETFGGAWWPRIIDYALSTPLIFVCNEFFFDNSVTLFVILLIFSAYGLLMFTGYASEVAWYDGKSGIQIFSPFVAGSIYFLCTWAPLMVQLEAGVRHSREESDTPVPWFVYAFIGWVFSSFLIFPWITLKKIVQTSLPKTLRAPRPPLQRTTYKNTGQGPRYALVNPLFNANI